MGLPYNTETMPLPNSTGYLTKGQVQSISFQGSGQRDTMTAKLYKLLLLPLVIFQNSKKTLAGNTTYLSHGAWRKQASSLLTRFQSDERYHNQGER